MEAEGGVNEAGVLFDFDQWLDGRILNFFQYLIGYSVDLLG
jgi:hypothetical protein